LGGILAGKAPVGGERENRAGLLRGGMGGKRDAQGKRGSTGEKTCDHRGAFRLFTGDVIVFEPQRILGKPRVAGRTVGLGGKAVAARAVEMEFHRSARHAPCVEQAQILRFEKTVIGGDGRKQRGSLGGNLGPLRGAIDHADKIGARIGRIGLRGGQNRHCACRKAQDADFGRIDMPGRRLFPHHADRGLRIGHGIGA
ncbi:hypothetical protein KXV85_003481, partial [Aspergillus fumigatus]